MSETSPARPLGDPRLPRYYHHRTGLVEHIRGETIRQRDAAKRKLTAAVKRAGGDPSEILYCAGGL